MYLVGFALSNVLGIVLMVAMTGKGLLELAHADYSNHDVLMATYVAQIVGVVVAFIVPTLVFTKLNSRNFFGELKMNKGSKLALFLLAAVIMVVANPLVDFLSDLNGKIPFPDFVKKLEDAAQTEQQAFLAHQGIKRLLANVFMIGFLAALCEELFFRAVMQKIMIKWTNSIHWGVWITGAIFSILHLEFLGFFPRMLMGVYLGYLFVWSGSLWVSVVAHFINNSLIVVILYLNPAMVASDKLNLGTPSQQTMYVIASAVLVTGLMFLTSKLRVKEEESLTQLT